MNLSLRWREANVSVLSLSLSRSLYTLGWHLQCSLAPAWALAPSCTVWDFPSRCCGTAWEQLSRVSHPRRLYRFLFKVPACLNSALHFAAGSLWKFLCWYLLFALCGDNISYVISQTCYARLGNCKWYAHPEKFNLIIILLLLYPKLNPEATSRDSFMLLGCGFV